jgi:hypothetical protein
MSIKYQKIHLPCLAFNILTNERTLIHPLSVDHRLNSRLLDRLVSG